MASSLDPSRFEKIVNSFDNSTGAKKFVGNALFGRPETSPLSPFQGKRFRPYEPGANTPAHLAFNKTHIPIERAEYDAIRAGKKLGLAHEGLVDGKQLFFKRKFIPGGATGFAMKHPIATAGLGLASYWLLKNKGQLQQAMADRNASQQAALAQQQQQQQSELPAVNPLSQKVWG